MIKEVKGDLLKANEGIIAHQVNCCGVMGAGVAKHIKQLIGMKNFSYYKEHCDNKQGMALGDCMIQQNPLNPNQYIAHLFGENVPTGSNVDTDYNALETAFWNLKGFLDDADNQGRVRRSVAIPGYIGCGLAGGDWNIVYQIILQEFEQSDIQVVIYYLPESVERLWREFGYVPADPETGLIEADFHHFAKGTNRKDIWKWFEETFDVSVDKDLLHL